MFVLRNFLVMAAALLCYVSVGYSQGNESVFYRNIIENVARTFKNSTNYRVDFVISSPPELPQTKGYLIVNDGKFRVVVSDNIIIFDGKALYNYNKTNNEVTIENPPKSGSIINNPVAAFNIDLNNFNITSFKDELQLKDTIRTVELTPKIKDADIERVEVSVKGSNKIPAKIVIYPIGSDNNVIMDIDKVTINIPPSPELMSFDFDKNRGVEVIDFR